MSNILKLILSLLVAFSFGAHGQEVAPVQGSDIPAGFSAPAIEKNYSRREVMVPMRDGVRLFTVILVRNDAKDAPIVIDRTPYGARRFTNLGSGSDFAGTLLPYHADLMRAGYIIVLQDVRGKEGSEGEYQMTRPLRGAINTGDTDHSTDAYDTIDWLVKNVPESNGRVATTGISYDGFTALMSLVNPHPALKASVPIDAMVDGWIGDDWFHNGAYRQYMMEYIFKHTGTKSVGLQWPDRSPDSYNGWLERGSAGDTAKLFGIDKLPAWQRMADNPAYNEFWQQQALDKILARTGISVPTMIVHSRWDQEDIYGPMAVYRSVKPKDSRNLVSLVMGPWNHGGSFFGNGDAIGSIRFGSDTGHWFRQNALIPFLDQHLKDDGKPANLRPVLSFETGTNIWRSFDVWPLSCAKGCPHQARPLYLRQGGRLSFERPDAAGKSGYSEYLSDPAKPVTFRQRPIEPLTGPKKGWAQWLVEDQRFAGSRPDVLTFVTDVLTEPVRIAGQPIANIFASTTGTDSDWIVKLIDVYPAEYADEPSLGGYELPVAMEIFRGRYREDLAKARPIQPGKVLPYRFALPEANHVFRPGHRIMVQIQSSWFPLYDRNPQKFVDNIFFAKPEDYIKATQRVYHRAGAESFVELPIVP